MRRRKTEETGRLNFPYYHFFSLTIPPSLPPSLPRQSDRYRECPKQGCGRMIKGCACSPSLSCPDCQTKFCFFHSNAHPHKSCWQYAFRLRKDSQQVGR